ncbi:MAG: dienelactone hydrolase [Phycisphaerae bacterium]|nr:dienelactone hydrolase [Phycisphaerae bacterium]MDG1358841.1 dihydrolipoamide acetyltransferase family protein [Phycisphaerales bacterium]MDG1978255.1 dihydrolipoamide acetyltransferase family protein [Phycisphaerales bacterium]MDG2133942.1 dihydrolipoamide acetyltransferase family protein [Phycisphaerales bacterium]
MAATKQPADKSHFILPDLGEGVHEAELISWKVKPGEPVKEHQTMAEMETDKALVEVPSPWTGVIDELRGSEGDIINVGSILVTYKVDGGGATAAPSKDTPAEAPKDDESGEGDQGTVVGTMSGTLEVSSRFSRNPEHETTGNGVVAEGKAMATPAVRRVARELGIDIDHVPGTGRGGRVTASDVHAHASLGRDGAPAANVNTEATDAAVITAASLASPPRDLPAVSADGIKERIPFRGVRRKIAQALDLSVKTAVHFTVVDEVDVTELEVKRREYAKVLGTRLSLLPFIMTATCRALRKHPAINANVDDAREEILIKDVVNLGCAVDTEHGLMVPVIGNADRLSLVELGRAVADVAEGCKNRTIPRERLTGGTFTISNVGSYGGRFATPIINYPEVGILAAGRSFEKVMAKDGMIFAGTALPLSLSCDHRVVDGAEGARFLNTVKRLLEDPGSLLA